MSTPVRPLALAQRDFADFVTSVDAPDKRTVAQYRSERGIPAEARLRVYSNAYFARIHGALRDDYGALHAALGDDAFHDLVKLYLMAHPSRSFSLRFAGQHLRAFLSGPAAEFFQQRWPFAADLAALEWAQVDVFDAPDARTLERVDLAKIAPDDWSGIHFRLVPALQRLSLAWPVHDLRTAWSAGHALPQLQRSPTAILVHRHDERVFQRALSPPEARALDAIARGEDFAAICASVAGPADDAESSVRVLGFLERWLAEGLLSR